MSILFFIAILVALIWVHELGHFLAAKAFRVRVDEFAIGFPPRLFCVRLGETNYTFNLLLIGGFVRIYGENAGEGAGDPSSLLSRSRPVQAVVLVAGIVFNLAFGWLVLSSAFLTGFPMAGTHEGFGTVENTRPTIIAISSGSPSQSAGIEDGDVLVRMNTGSADVGEVPAAEGRAFIETHQDESIIFTVERKGEERSFLAKPVEGLLPDKKAVGIQLEDIGTLTLPPHLALAQGAIAAKNLTVATAQGLGAFFGGFFVGKGSFEGVAGPIGIVEIGSKAVQTGYAQAAVITALISINLALINLLPVPGLDGGRLFILAIEGVLRRPLSRNLSMGLTLAGFGLIVLLMVLVTYQDIVRLIW